MTNDPYRDRLSDYIDQALADAERREIEAHLTSCDACAATLSALRSIRRDARALGPVEPPPSVWEAVSATITQDEHVRHRAALTRMMFAVAAAVVLGVGMWLAARPEPADSNAELASRVTEELEAAEIHYENAIVGLEQIIRDNDGSLPPEVRETVSSNLELIESTINESREAINAEPDSAAAQESLLDGFRRKVDLLQNTILLINEVRKGQSENALELIDEIRKSEDPSNPI